MDTLKDRIEARKQEAKDKKIGDKAQLVANVLGSQNTKRVHGGTEYTGEFSNDSFRINWEFVSLMDGCGGGTEIRYKGSLVFHEGGGDIHSYIPGAWEGPFEALYLQALELQPKRAAIAAAKNAAEIDEHQAETAKKFGL